MNIYEENGFPTREAYLEWLAQEHEVPLADVQLLAHVLGEEEDFDGLVLAVADRGEQIMRQEDATFWFGYE